ncbi:hypothetical protein Nepgr_017350 [Nepenthes gracilis]|uniref:Uncharacterized protein n=1 Tax=Nepenthes gracilis TaxID=150966 RepID=A0AAD3XT06_NEPGR|nr:hypothetical protein Nepgr_017350 [Nepenthes gracilis]
MVNGIELLTWHFTGVHQRMDLLTWPGAFLPLPDLACGGCRFGLRLDGLSDVESFCRSGLEGKLPTSHADLMCGQFCRFQMEDKRLPLLVYISIAVLSASVSSAVLGIFGHSSSLCNNSTKSSKVELCSKKLENLLPAPSFGDVPVGNSKVGSAMDSSFSPAVGDGQLGDMDLSQHEAENLCDPILIPPSLKPVNEVYEFEPDASSFTPLVKAPIVKVVRFALEILSTEAASNASHSRKMAPCSDTRHPIVFRRSNMGLMDSIEAPVDAVPILASLLLLLLWMLKQRTRGNDIPVLDLRMVGLLTWIPIPVGSGGCLGSLAWHGFLPCWA